MEAVDLLAIKDLGGWKSLAMVQRYAHLSPAHRREAIERFVTRAKTTETAPAAGAEWHRDSHHNTDGHSRCSGSARHVWWAVKDSNLGPAD